MCSHETSGSAWMQCYLCAVQSCVYNRTTSQSLAASALARVGVCSWLTLRTASSGAARTLPKFWRCERIAIHHDKQQQELFTCSPLASACASLRKTLKEVQACLHIMPTRTAIHASCKLLSSIVACHKAVSTAGCWMCNVALCKT